MVPKLCTKGDRISKRKFLEKQTKKYLPNGLKSVNLLIVFVGGGDMRRQYLMHNMQLDTIQSFSTPQDIKTFA